MREKQDMLRAIGEAMRKQDFSSPEQAHSFLNQFIGMKMGDVTEALTGGVAGNDVEERAEDLFFEAVEARSMGACRRRLKEVLRLVPDHVRARTMLAKTEKNPGAAEKGFREAIASGERNLGALLDKGGGHLWGFIEARPYLEARAELAAFLAVLGRADESIEEHRAILVLNENDNQGVRDPLLSLLLQERRFADAGALVKKYDTDYSAVWLYSKAMLEFQRRAEEAQWATEKLGVAWLKQQMAAMAKGIMPKIPEAVRAADETLFKALKFNPWCAIRLLTSAGHSADDLPESYGPGSEEEAALFFHHHAPAWIKNPPALLWLTARAVPWLIKNGFGDHFAP